MGPDDQSNSSYILFGSIRLFFHARRNHNDKIDQPCFKLKSGVDKSGQDSQF